MVVLISGMAFSFNQMSDGIHREMKGTNVTSSRTHRLQIRNGADALKTSTMGIPLILLAQIAVAFIAWRVFYA